MGKRLPAAPIGLASAGLFLALLAVSIRLHWWDEAIQQLRERLQLGDGPLMGLNIRDLLWFALVVVLVIVWLVDRRQLACDRRGI